MPNFDPTILKNAVIRARQGDREAFGVLVDLCRPIVLNKVRKVLGNIDDAEEITQDTFVRVMERLGQLRDPGSFIGWLLKTAQRLALNRVKRRESRTVTNVEIPDQEVAAEETPHDRAATIEQHALVRELISDLRPLDRDTLRDYYIKGLSIRQMADRTGAPEGTIKRRLNTARTRLRAKMVRHPVFAEHQRRARV